MVVHQWDCGRGAESSLVGEVFSGQFAEAAAGGAEQAELARARDGDDALQEALLRAWRGLARFEGRSSLRTWLYTVATRACLDLVATRGKRALPTDLGPSSERAVLDQVPRTDVAWLGPYPDSGLTEGWQHPEARYEQREAVELAFVAAL